MTFKYFQIFFKISGFNKSPENTSIIRVHIRFTLAIECFREWLWVRYRTPNSIFAGTVGVGLYLIDESLSSYVCAPDLSMGAQNKM